MHNKTCKKDVDSRLQINYPSLLWVSQVPKYFLETLISSIGNWTDESIKTKTKQRF